MEENIRVDCPKKRLNLGSIHNIKYSNNLRTGYAIIEVPQGVASETYLTEFSDGLIGNGYISIVRKALSEYPRIHLFYFTKELINFWEQQK